MTKEEKGPNDIPEGTYGQRILSLLFVRVWSVIFFLCATSFEIVSLIFVFFYMLWIYETDVGEGYYEPIKSIIY